MSALTERLRAVLALSGPLGAGSRALTTRLVTRYGWRPVLGGGTLTGYACLRYDTAPAWVAAAWCAAALMHAPKTADATAEEAEPEDLEETDEGDQEPDVATLLHELVGDDRGVLLTRIQQALALPDTRAVRTLLDEAGIPTRKGVRTAAGNGPGVHRADLPPLPQPGAPVGVVAAGQTANTNTNNAPTVEQVGSGGVIVRDPADTRRHHTIT
ncbi:hypothetical protein [Streptomyces sp. MJP52]|uniref:hypothetical protein n=1 Tax=Streptomyces sp. MJP52 TaxID=2940555 RepID=UPI002474AA9C|nr:hypothetical protein [Streptomyces sp. MJP52]MDH6226227.1 hypothetical protein [Streptomyces sp. MJP52]